MEKSERFSVLTGGTRRRAIGEDLWGDWAEGDGHLQVRSGVRNVTLRFWMANTKPSGTGGVILEEENLADQVPKGLGHDSLPQRRIGTSTRGFS